VATKNDAKILIVDDEDDVRNSISAFVTSLGFKKVDTANGVDDGLTKAGKGNYDLVLLDMMMPKKSGWGFLEEARARKLKIRVLVLSAVGLPEVVHNDVKGKYPAPNVEFMSKTYITDQLEEMMVALLKVPAGVP